jgi:hypothetical protein
VQYPAISAPVVGTVAVLAALAGVVEAVIRTARSGWVPVSDDAAIALRAHDMFTRHVPLVGMPSTLGAYAHGHAASHLGPLEFFALAPTYALSGRSPVGLLIGVLLVNAAAVIAIAWASNRIGGVRVLVFAMALIAFLAWGLGPLLGEIWNADVPLLPFAAFVVLAVAVGNRVLVALPWALLFGSFAVQAHLSYLGLVGIITLWTVGLAAWHGVRELRSTSGDARHAVVSRLRRIVVWSVVVVAACWWAPIVQQFTSSAGNLSAVASGFTSPSSSGGAAFGVHYVGLVVGLPPPFGKAPFDIAVGIRGHASAFDGVRFLFPWLVAVAGIVIATRRRAYGALATFATGAVTLFATTLTAVRTPVISGTTTALVYNMRWLWPAAIVFWFTVGLGAWQLFCRPSDVRGVHERGGERVGWPTAALCLVAVVIALWPRPGVPAASAADTRLTRLLAGRVVPALDGHGPYLLRSLGSSATITVVPGLAVDLERHGIGTYIDARPRPPIPPWGAQRVYTNQPIAGTIWVVSGNIKAPTVSARAIATATGATPAMEREAAQLRATILDAIGPGGVQLTAAGDRMASDPSRFPGHAAQLASVRSDPAAALDDGTLATLAAQHLVSLPDAAKDVIETYERLRPLVSTQWDATVFLDGPPADHAGVHGS